MQKIIHIINDIWFVIMQKKIMLYALWNWMPASFIQVYHKERKTWDTKCRSQAELEASERIMCVVYREGSFSELTVIRGNYCNSQHAPLPHRATQDGSKTSWDSEGKEISIIFVHVPFAFSIPIYSQNQILCVWNSSFAGGQWFGQQVLECGCVWFIFPWTFTSQKLTFSDPSAWQKHGTTQTLMLHNHLK